MPQPIVAVCTPMIGDVKRITHDAILRLRIPRPFHRLSIYDRTYSDARNSIVGRVLTDPALADVTHLLWIDDDMAFEPDAAERLLAHDLPIVGGLCHGRRGPTYAPIVLKRDPVTGHYKYWYDFPRGLVEVDATGAAFILVRREVYEAIEEKFATPGIGPYTQHSHGEDVSFCERARDCGFKVMIDTTVEIGHIAEVVVDSNVARRLRAVEFDAWAPPAPEDAEPVCSVVIPTFDQRPEWLRSAVLSALGQTAPTEVIVVDNGSTRCLWCGGPWRTGDEWTVPVCDDVKCPGPPKHRRLKIARITTNAGHPWDATNLGLSLATTPWFAWLPSDDLWHPRKIEKQISVVVQTGARVVASAYDVFSSLHGVEQRGVVPAPVWRNHDEQHRALAQGCAVNLLTLLVAREEIDRIVERDGRPAFDGASYRVAADWEFMIRLSDHGLRFAAVHEILASRNEDDTETERIVRDASRAAGWAREVEQIRTRYGAG